MDRVAVPAHPHEAPHNTSSNSVPHSNNWGTAGSAATLPHAPLLHSNTLHQHHYHYQVQQHNRTRSNSGRDGLLNTSTDSTGSNNWRPTDQAALSINASSYTAPPPPPSQSHNNISSNNTTSTNNQYLSQNNSSATSNQCPPHNTSNNTQYVAQKPLQQQQLQQPISSVAGHSSQNYHPSVQPNSTVGPNFNNPLSSHPNSGGNFYPGAPTYHPQQPNTTPSYNSASQASNPSSYIPQQQQQQQQHHLQQQKQQTGQSYTTGTADLNSSFCSNSNLNTSFGPVSMSSIGVSNSSTVASNHPAADMDNNKEVNLKSALWFHSKITRDEAEQLLQPRKDGLFLVRESTNFPGDYTLCVCYQSKVEHYRVIYENNRLTIDREEFFNHLTELVQHYEKEADGLCTHLVRALPSQAALEYEDRVEAFKDGGWEINKDDITIGNSIGKGEFGDVVLGDWLGKKVAVKRLKDNCRAAEQLLEEASLMTSLTHENLVVLMGLVFKEQSILLVTEYMSKGSLVDYLRSRGRLHVTKKDQIMFACDTAAGMSYLESRNVVHRDLAARNVLISQDDVAKVCDFGLAKATDTECDAVKFPIKWTAPEALRRNLFSNKSDMWSFGILLWEIYSFGRVPYPKIPLADVTKHVMRGYRMEAPDNCPEDVYKIMKEAWQMESDTRPTFEEIHKRLLDIKQTTPA